jgi:hypothetical protein
LADQEFRGQRHAVQQHAQNGQEIRPPLNLVQHHQPGLPPQDQLGILQAGIVIRVFQVENARTMHGGDLTGHCRLAALAWPQQGNTSAPLECGFDGVTQAAPLDHAFIP